MSRACASSQRRRRCSKVHHTCGALRSMQRTPHIVRRLVLDVQHAKCSIQHATRSIQRATRPIPTAAMRSQTPPLSEPNVHCAAPSVQHPTRKHTTYTLHHATRNIPVRHELSHWLPGQVSYNPQQQHDNPMQHCFHAMQHQTCAYRAQQTVQQASHTMPRTTHPMQRTYAAHTTVSNEDRAPPQSVRCCRP